MPDESNPSEPASPGHSSSHSESRRMRLTPEQRRVLGPARSRHDWAGAEEPTTVTRPPDDSAQTARPDPVGYVTEQVPPTSAAKTPTGAPWQDERSARTDEAFAEADDRRPVGRRIRTGGGGRIMQVQNIVLTFGVILFLLGIFYAGKKFDYWRYQITSRLRARGNPIEPDRYPGVAATDLVEQAIVAERVGNWQEAVDRLLAAKRKNLLYPGLFFHAGKLCYDHGDFDSADRWFDRAIAFHEDLGESFSMRGMIANGRRDYAAAERFFEAAAYASPFTAQYLYSWAEALRQDHKPKDAALRYQQAALRGTDVEENVCRFKARMAMIEAGEGAAVSDDLDRQRRAGPLPTDWLMTQAALDVAAGRLEDALRVISEARVADTSMLQGHFAVCAGDRFFSEAANHSSELAQAIRVAGPAR